MPKNKTDLPKLLTIRQAAEVLNVHVETLRRWDKQGKLKAIRVNERGDRRYKPEDIKKVISYEK
ncbi:MAG: DNA-binding protein [Candidatus Pacebacteria bacterium CG_4_10_14_3_um_filter_34_15]|jgi:excisionase family DNA binding protein|nr:MAG: DNA-binding protein [Candidatus Pacebacteria bacterium CG11_big_fil_rev_8_21_14_0_20_34_55]PIX81801.1 MAG: DNA-binding protein [Candidatus Pacebacteria bacterium CG_4_10_14_3_um_filter_34_15]PJC43960.1 MAG: DNA-binding protein [Candidatus Pacebacteria bacterium CG_4_9_14_0_2_um_filter_34_50]